MTSPNGGEILTGTVPITWEADDLDGDSLTYIVRYSPDNGGTWLAVTVDLTETSYELDTSELPGTDQGIIQVIATDGVNTTTDSSDGVFSVPEKGPVAYISLPVDGSTLPSNIGVTLVGSAYDPEDGVLCKYLNHRFMSW